MDKGASPSGDRAFAPAASSQPEAVSPVPASIPSAWQSMDNAPKDRPILVWFDHDADPYQDPSNPGRLTDYACHADGGSYFTGQGMAVAQWCEGWHEDDGWESANPPYWMPAAWWAQIDGDNSDYVVNPVLWIDVQPPASAIEARRGETRSGSVHESAAPSGETPNA